MAIVIFVTHGRQEYCLTKHLVIIFNTGFCITLILAALTPCARRPGNGVDRGRYGGRLLQAGCVVVYVTYWTWSAMQSSPERPGIVEMSTFLMDEDDLTCQVIIFAHLMHNRLLIPSWFLTIAKFTTTFAISKRLSRCPIKAHCQVETLFRCMTLHWRRMDYWVRPHWWCSSLSPTSVPTSVACEAVEVLVWVLLKAITTIVSPSAFPLAKMLFKMRLSNLSLAFAFAFSKCLNRLCPPTGLTCNPPESLVEVR